MTGEARGGGFAGWRPLALAFLWTAVFTLLTLAVAVALSTVLFLAAREVVPSVVPWFTTLGPNQLFVQGVVTIAAAAMATALVARWTALGWDDLRWRGAGPVARGVSAGFLLGAVPAGLTVLLIAGAGGASWVSAPGDISDLLGAGAVILTILLPAALAEELIFRGVPLVLFGRAVGIGSAVVLLAAGFAAVHLRNPGVTGLAVANIALAGVLLGTIFLGPGGLWAATAAHWGWNATLAMAGASVSGIPLGLPHYQYRPGGPLWLTGGAFGPEGGLAATVMLGVAVVVAAGRLGRRPHE